MFKVIVHYDGHTFEDAQQSYEKALLLLMILDTFAANLRANAVIGDFYIELIKEG